MPFFVVLCYILLEVLGQGHIVGIRLIYADVARYCYYLAQFPKRLGKKHNFGSTKVAILVVGSMPLLRPPKRVFPSEGNSLVGFMAKYS